MKTKAVGIALLLALWALAGCGGDEVGGPTTADYEAERARVAAQVKKSETREKQAAKAAPEAAPPQESQIGRFASVGENYTYSAEGRRDPFQPFRIDTTADERKGGGPLEQFELEQLEVVALVWRGDTARALVTDPSGTTYTVRVGSRMGKNEGRVIHIGDNLVLVKETYVDYAGNESTKDVELRIRTSQQGG